jgi:hypothetical protein
VPDSRAVQSGHVIRPALPASKYFLTRKEKNDGGFKHPTSPILLQLLLSTTEGNARNCKYCIRFLLSLERQAYSGYPLR